MTMLLCYNRGCGKEYDADSNGPTACTFHPGEPVFHDAYKSWSCCKKRCIDFTEFLNIKGCTQAPHSNVKPVSAQPVAKPVPVVNKETESPRPKVERMARPPLDGKLVNVAQELTPSLKNLISSTETVKPDLENKNCYNKSCSVKYADRDSSPVCTYHPGEAVFHEGLKYWSCCKKKAMDFEEFMKQPGCTKGDHSWSPTSQVVDCRFDWHQTATHVTATIYAKGYDTKSLKIQSNGSKLNVSLDLTVGRFHKEWIVYGVIDPSQSKALLMGTKVEIKLRKAEPIQWPIFDIERPSSPVKAVEVESGPPVDAVDLDDL